MRHVILALFTLRLACGGILVHSGAPEPVPEATFFSFDTWSVPLRHNLQVTMVPARKRPDPVLTRGQRGSFDELRAEYYGTVVRTGGKFRMWYVGYGFEDPSVRTVAGVTAHIGYAESNDGIQWTKPDLGLVEYHGNKANNIVAIEPRDYTSWLADRNIHILYEPDDPDPTRRYKLMMYVPHEGGRDSMIPLFSEDGLRWRYALPVHLTEEAHPRFKISSLAMPNEHLEGGGLVRYGGLYYDNGQSLNLYSGKLTGRFAATYTSSDFLHWLPEKAVSLMRWGYDIHSPINESKEVHEGIALWNRGNVLVGLFGMWEGAASWADRRVHLGVAVSTDALHFVEPVPNFIFAPAGKKGEWDANGVLQGQGFWKVGDRDYIWYGSWNLAASPSAKYDPEKDMLVAHGDVGLMTIRHDGFGYAGVLDPKTAQRNETFGNGTGSLVTAPFDVAGGPAQVFLNAEAGNAGKVRLEVLDRGGIPVKGFTAADFTPLDASGIRLPAAWSGGAKLAAGTYRLRAILDRRGGDSPKLYAIYIASADGSR